METTMLHGVNPEQLKELISISVKNEIEVLKKEFQPKEPDSYLTREETKTLLKISNFCLHNWMNKGILKPYKVGNRTYFKRSDIEEIINNSNK